MKIAKKLKPKNTLIVVSICILIIISANFLTTINCQYHPLIGNTMGDRASSRSTPVPGQHIANNTTWTAANSPYIIEGDVYVDQDVNLTIEPNVVVKFNGFFSLFIAGKLIAIGTETGPIEFTSNTASPDRADWESIEITSTGYAELKFVKISYGNKSLFIEGASNNLIENVEILECNMWGLWLNKSHNNVIRNCNFHHNSWSGIYLDAANNNEIFNSNFNNNDYDGLTADYSNGNIITNCTFRKNLNDGIHLFSSGNTQVTNCMANENKEIGAVFANSAGSTISELEANFNNKIGIFIKESENIDIVDCNFSGNGQGLYLYYTDDIELTNSNFLANTDMGIYLEDSSNNNIKDCTVGYNFNTGIFLREEYIYKQGSYFNTITNCEIFNNSNGVYLKSAPGSVLTELEIFNNSNGIFFFEADDSKITHSEIANNNNGIRVFRSEGIEVTNCKITNNLLGISMGAASTGNSVHHNDILNNNISAGDGNVGNNWDDTNSAGNYWSDYNGTDLDQNGIGDQPHVISNTSQDNYPLVDEFNIVLKVISTDPQNNAILVPQNLSINLTFSEQLNRTTVIGNITISPSTEIIGYEWYDNDRSVSLQVPTLKNGTSYFVTINTNITNLTGKPLKFPYYFRFTTEDPYNQIRPYVTAHFPKGINVPITTDIQINFSFPMYRQSVVQAFSIKPKVNVNVQWLNDMTVVFAPVKNFAILTVYTIIINTDAINLIGNSLEDAYIFTFTTEVDHYPPKVIEHHPLGYELASVNLERITIIFDEPVYTNSVEERFEVLPPVKGAFEWFDDNQELRYNLQTQLIYNEIYTVKLLPGLMDALGNPTNDTYEFSFRTVPGITPEDQPPYIIDRYPTGEKIVEVDTKYLFIAFNEPVDTSSVKKRFYLYPPTTGSFEWKNNNQTMYFKFDTNLLYNITYTMKLWPGLKDLEGNPTTDLYEFMFKTEPGVSPFEALEYSPTGTEVPLDTYIQIIFNKYANQSSVETAFVIDPDAVGNFSWNETTFIFMPGANLSSNTTYKIIIGDWVEDSTGVKLGTALSWELTTALGAGDGDKPDNGNVTPPEEDGQSRDEDDEEVNLPQFLVCGIIIIIVIIIILILYMRGKEEAKPAPKKPLEKPKGAAKQKHPKTKTRKKPPAKEAKRKKSKQKRPKPKTPKSKKF